MDKQERFAVLITGPNGELLNEMFGTCETHGSGNSFLPRRAFGLGSTNPEDLTKRSLVDLVNIEVTSVAKKEQKMSQTASAVFVITANDIRRSGATNIPDLLRMVPGVGVAHINSNK